MTTHAFDRGDIVTIFNRSMSGLLIIEGKAKIVSRRDQPNLYSVRFTRGGYWEHDTYDRFVFPGDCQSDPEGWLLKALAEEAA